MKLSHNNKDMDVQLFIQQRAADWQQLDQLLCQVNSSRASRQTDNDIVALSRLSQAVTADLALAQRDYPEHPVTVYLNHLVGRCHQAVYRVPADTPGRLRPFLTQELPALYREALPFIVAAALLLLLPGILAGVAVAVRPDAADWLGLATEAEIMQDGRLWTDIPAPQRPGASSFIMQNNIQVSFYTFVGGLPFGLLTVYVLLTNGLHLGGIIGLAARYGLLTPLLTFIVGHGILELSIICIAAGGGLMMGWALLRPGLLCRVDALVIASHKAAKLLAACIIGLVLAGIVEGFVSPTALPLLVKALLGITLAAGFHAWLLLTGKG
ncbi:MAG: stage II sporulation protein M [Chloroflexi bacterium]|nr:stage II sporulation protein M [Chloroflexota bacterium]